MSGPDEETLSALDLEVVGAIIKVERERILRVINATIRSLDREISHFPSGGADKQRLVYARTILTRIVSRIEDPHLGNNATPQQPKEPTRG